MKTLKTLLILATTFAALHTVANQLQAKDFRKSVLNKVSRAVKHEFHKKPRCTDPRRCPQPRPRPRPYPQPAPQCHDYFLGVWTTLVELVPSTEQPLAAFSQPTTRVAPGHGQPTYGLQVDRVVRFSPAERAGLEAGDVLLTANGVSLQCKQDLFKAIRRSHGHLTLLVLDARTGEVVTIQACPTPK